MTRTRTPGLLLGAVGLLLVSGALMAAPATKKAKAKPPVQPGVRGTQQMAGGGGVFGQTYTLKSGFNFTLVSAEYSVARVNAYEPHIPTADEKLLVLHVRIKNSNSADAFFDPSAHSFTAVDSDDQDHAGGSDYGRTSTGKVIATTLKPGQGYDDAYTCVNVPAKGPITKLILNAGRMGTSEDVMRFAIGGKNVIAPLPAYARDSADASGATALTKVPAQPQTYYPLGQFDAQLVAFSFSDGPLNGSGPDDGKQFAVATVTIKNQVLAPTGFYNGLLAAKVNDVNDDNYEADVALKAAVDQEIGTKELENGQEYTVRFRFQVPKPAGLKTLTLVEAGSRTYVFDVSGYK